MLLSFLPQRASPNFLLRRFTHSHITCARRYTTSKPTIMASTTGQEPKWVSVCKEHLHSVAID